MSCRRKTYIFDYLGVHCGMHYYDESFSELLSTIPGHDVTVLSNFFLSERHHRFCPNMFRHGQAARLVLLVATAAKLFLKRLLHPRSTFVFLSYGNLYEMAFMPSILLFGRRNVVDVHEAVAQKDDGRKVHVAYFRLFYRRLVRNAIIHSDRTRSFMDKFGFAGTTLYVPHFKYRLRRHYDNAKVGSDVREALSTGNVKVLFFGNITSEKGADILLEAYMSLPEEYRSRMDVIVAGKDKDGSVYRVDTRNERNVHIIARHINDDELVRLYSACDYVALPYRKTSQSGIMEMAFYFRRKVIATSVPYFVSTLEVLPSFGVVSDDGVEGYARALKNACDERGRYEFGRKDLERYGMRKEMDAFRRQYETSMLRLSQSEIDAIDSRRLTADRLFCLLRAAMNGDIDDARLFEGMDDAAWTDIYKLSARQGVLAVAYDGMKMLDEAIQPVIDIRAQWGYNVSHIEHLSSRQVATAEQVCGMLAAQGVRMMIMKGLTHSARYPKPLHRQCGDIDIFLMGNYGKGDRIAAMNGYEVVHDFFVHSEFRVNGINIENHRYFVNHTVNRTGARVQKFLAEEAERCSAHPLVGGAIAPSADFEAVFLTRHAIWHFSRECIRLRDLVDWCLFLKSGGKDIDADRVVGFLRDTGMDRFASILTGICRSRLGLDTGIEFGPRHLSLEALVTDDMLNYDNPYRHFHSGVTRTFYRKLTSRFERKWCYDLIVPDSFYGNILSSVRDYIRYPWKILTSKV